MPEAAIDALYAEPLDRFVAARDALAASASSKEEAARIRALAKPSVPAWAVNQLARHEEAAMRSLAEIGQRLRAAHDQVLAGGDPDPLHAARTDERTAIASLVARAEAILAGAGYAPNAARAERVADTLSAMAADEATAATVLAGCLTKELQRVGFGETAVPPAARPAKAPSTPADDDGARRAAAMAAAEERARDAIAAAERARADAEGAARTAEETDARAQQARADANDARRAAERAEREAADAVRSLEEMRGS